MEFRRTKTYDLLSAGPLICLYGLASWGLWLQATAAMHAALAAGSAARALDAAVFIASLVFVALQTVLFIARREPVLFSQGWRPRAIALVAANLSIMQLLLPRNTMPPVVHAISGALIVAGTTGSIWALSYLGRAFSILPQARQLTTHGPYRFVRHPLYLSEIVAMLGVTLQFRQPWAAIIFVITLALLIMRMGYEERVLAEAFPGYLPYAAKTPRLVPGLY